MHLELNDLHQQNAQLPSSAWTYLSLCLSGACHSVNGHRQNDMAELLSVQVHVPLTKGEDGRLSEKTTGFPRLKKIENRSALDSAKSKFHHLPDRKAVDIEFRGLTYSVSEGRRKGKTPILPLSVVLTLTHKPCCCQR